MRIVQLPYPRRRLQGTGALRRGREVILAYPGDSEGSTGRYCEGKLLRLETAVARELQCAAVLRYRPNDVVGGAFRDIRFDFQCDLHL